MKATRKLQNLSLLYKMAGNLPSVSSHSYRRNLLPGGSDSYFKSSCQLNRK